MNPTPGVRTSEFWITLFIQLLSAFVASGLLPTEHPSMRMAAFILAGAATLGYQVSRGMVKMSAAKSPPQLPPEQTGSGQ